MNIASLRGLRRRRRCSTNEVAEVFRADVVRWGEVLPVCELDGRVNEVGERFEGGPGGGGDQSPAAAVVDGKKEGSGIAEGWGEMMEGGAEEDGSRRGNKGGDEAEGLEGGWVGHVGAISGLDSKGKRTQRARRRMQRRSRKANRGCRQGAGDGWMCDGWRGDSRL